METPLPPACRAFAATRFTRLAAAWGTYAWKGWSTLTDVVAGPDGRVVWALGHDLTVTCWDAVTGEPLIRVPLEPQGSTEGSVPAIGALLPDGARLLVTRNDGSLALYDLHQVSRIWRTDAVGPGGATVPVISALAVSADGKLCATAAPGELRPTIRLWSVELGAEVRQIEGEAYHLTFLPNGLLVVDGQSVLDPATGAVAYAIPGPPGASVAAGSPDGAQLVVGNAGGDLWCWDTAKLAAPRGSAGPPQPAWKGKNTNPWGDKSPIDHVAISRDGGWVLTVSTLSHQRWSLAVGRRVESTRWNGTWRVSYAPDGSRAFGVGLQSKRIRHLDLVQHGEVRPPYEHEEAITGLALSPDGRICATGSSDGTVRLWDVATDRPLGVIGAGAVHAVAFSTDGRRVISGTDQGGNVHDVATLEKVTGWSAVSLGTGGFSGIAPSPDGSAVVFVDRDGSVLRWDLKASREVWRRSKVFAKRAAFSPDGASLLVTTALSRLEAWDAATGATQAEHPVPDRLATQPQVLLRDGRTVLALHTGEGLVLRDLGSGSVIRPFPGSARAAGVLVVCPFERLALTATPEGLIQLWDIAGASALDAIDLSTSFDVATCAAFTPDGRTFVVGTRRGVVLRFVPA